jgi:hypothetical protein
MQGNQATSTTSARSRWGVACLLALGLLAGWPAAAQSANPDVLKAEVIYRLLMFVTWPTEREGTGRALQLCTLGEGRMDSALQSLAGRSIRHLSVEVRHQARPEQLAGCHLLYLPAAQPALRAALAELPILVVSDMAAMLDQGAMINLQIEDGRIVFDVDLDAARRAGLAVSTQLLRLARFVRHRTTSP